MKNSTYYTRLSNGATHRVEFATSAGEAVYQALLVHRGATVTGCWQGPEMQDRRYPHGEIRHEVPPHEPIPHDYKVPSRRRPKDTSEVMGFMEGLTQ